MSDNRCTVCDGAESYPIIDRHGREVFSITCPQCDGSGLSDDGEVDRMNATRDRVRYDAAMAEMRAGR